MRRPLFESAAAMGPTMLCYCKLRTFSCQIIPQYFPACLYTVFTVSRGMKHLQSQGSLRLCAFFLVRQRQLICVAHLPSSLHFSAILLLAFWSPSSGNLVAANPSTPLPSETTISSAAPSRASLLKALTEVNDTLVASQSSQHQKSLDESRDAVAKPKQYRPFSSGGILPPQTSYVSNKTESSTAKSVKCEHTEFQVSESVEAF